MAVEYPEQPIIIEGFSLRFMRQYALIPVAEQEDGYLFAAADPDDPSTRQGVELFINKPITWEQDDRDRILARIDRLYGQQAAVMQETDVVEEAEMVVEGSEPGENELRDQALEAPVIRRVNVLMAQAVEAGASDIHLESMESRFVIRFRVDGVLREQDAPPKDMERAIISRLKLMAKMNIAERRLPQDGRLKTFVLGQEVDLRVSTSPGLYGESMVIRLLTRQHQDISLDRLGIGNYHTQILNNLIREPNGIILVTGPTGSGKSTSLYCILQEINDPGKKIITMEDPVEYQLDGVVQIAVRSEIGLTFAKGLRTIVRQDPDVIMIGEIRDAETAEIAVQAALTGHLVFSTLHTNDAVGAIARLQELDVPPFLLAASLKGVIAQRLLRRVCSDCSERQPLTDYEQSYWGRHLPKALLEQGAPKAQGCKQCDNTGYRGRVGIFEILPITQRMAWLMSGNANPAEYQEELAKMKHRSLLDNALEKVVQGATTLEETERVVGRDSSSEEAA